MMQSYVLSAEESSSECGDKKDSKDQKKKKKSSHKSQDKDAIEEPEKISSKKSKSPSSIDAVPNKSQSKNVQGSKITNDDIDLESEEDLEVEYRKMQSYVLSAEDSSSECGDRKDSKDKKKKKSSHKSQDKNVIEEPEKNSLKKSKSSSSIDAVPKKSQSKNVQATKITNDDIDLESEEDPEEEYRKMQSYVLSAEDSSSECGGRKDSKDKKKKKSSHKSQDKDLIEEPEKNSPKKSKSSSSIDDVPHKSQPKNVQATKITNDDIDLESEEDPEEEYRKMQSYVLSAEDSSSECGDRKDSKDKKKKKSKHKSQDKDVIEEPEKISSKKSKPSPSTDDVSNNSQSKNVQATEITIDEIDLESEDDPDEEYRKMQSYVISDQDSSSERGDRKDSKNGKKRKKSPDEVITEQQEKISSKKSKSTSLFDTNSSNFHSSNKMKGKTTHHQFDTESSDENPEMIDREMQSYSMSHKSSTGDCSDKLKEKNKNYKKEINIEDMDIVFQEDSELECAEMQSSVLLRQNKSNCEATQLEVESVGKNTELQKHTEVPAITEFTQSLSFEQIEIIDLPMDKSTLPNTGNHTCLRNANVADVNCLNDDMDLEPFPVFELDNGGSESFQFSPMKSSTYIDSIKNLPSSDSENDTRVSLRNTMGNADGIKRSEKEAVLRRDKCPSPSKNNEIIEIQTSAVTFIPNDFGPMKEIDITDFDQSAIENDANDRNKKSSSKQNSKIFITTKEDSSDDFSSEENIKTNISKNKPKTTKTRKEQQRKSAENKKTAKESSTDYDQSAVENEADDRNRKSSSKHNSKLSIATKEDSSADSSSEENIKTNISKNKPKTTKARREEQGKSAEIKKIAKESSTDYDQSAVENETNDRNRKSTSKHNSTLSKATEEDSSADFSSEENIMTNTSNNKPKTTKTRRVQQRKSVENKKSKESSTDDRIKKRKRSESKIKKVQKKNKVSIDESARKNGTILAFFSKQKKDNGSKVTKDSSQNQNEASVIRNTESPTDGEQNSQSLNVSIPNGEKDNSYSFADILSQSHSKRLEKEVEDILDKTSGAEKSSNSDRGSHLNYSSSSEDDPPTPKKKVLEQRDPREGEPHRNTENIKSINTGRKFSSISKDEQDLIEKRKKKKIIKLIKESKTLWEIRKTLEMDENDEYMKKIKELVIENPYPLTRIQRNSPSIINPPNNVIKEILEKKGIELKLGHFSQEEDVMIEESWNKFCELHNWDVNDLFPFLNCPSKSLHSVLTHKQLASFVQFISYGFKNRTMDNVYSRFQRIFSSKDRNNERFTKEDDKIIMLYKQTAESSRPFAEIGMILNRKRDAVMRRYHLLQRNKHMEQYKIQWNKALTEKFLVALIEVTCSINLAELKNRNITPQEWTQVGERMKLPAIKLKRSWMLNFYPRFFTNRYSKNIVNTTEKLVDIVSAKYSNWSEVDWGAVSDELGKDLPRSKCSKIVRDLVKNKVPLELRNNLNESMKYLSLQELKSGPDNFSFVRKILKETKNGTILPVINEDKV